MPSSVFDLFKVGIGPSSSHTVGPMVAARRFLLGLQSSGALARVARVKVSLHGSLAFTGKGHATDRAVLLGLCGERPDHIEPDAIEGLLREIRQAGAIRLLGERPVPFDEATDLIMDYDEPLPGHANGMRFTALDEQSGLIEGAVMYSVGGGFVVTEQELAGVRAARRSRHPALPFPQRGTDAGNGRVRRAKHCRHDDGQRMCRQGGK